LKTVSFESFDSTIDSQRCDRAGKIHSGTCSATMDRRAALGEEQPEFGKTRGLAPKWKPNFSPGRIFVGQRSATIPNAGRTDAKRIAEGASIAILQSFHGGRSKDKRAFE